MPPPIPPNNPLCGKPSDHSTPVATPPCSENIYKPKEYIVKVARPLPDSGMREFGQWICTEDWEDIPDDVSPTEQVLQFEQLVTDRLNVIFPQKTVRLTVNLDHPFITSELKSLDRQIKRIYRKQNKSAKYWRLKNAYNEKFKSAAVAYLEKNVRSLKEDDPGTAYRNMKKLGAQPGDCADEGSFTLLSHLEQGLSDEESIEHIAEHFAHISQEFPPFNYNLLPESVKVKLDSPVQESDIPIISDFDVYNKIRKSKKPRSSVPGDLPRRIVQEFGPELATPAAKIYRNIAKTGHWPKPWWLEYGTPLQKQANPVN